MALRDRLLKPALALAVLAATACTPMLRNHGYAPSDADLDQIIVGLDTRATVEEVVGRPSTTGVMDDGAWYYLSSRVRQYGWREPQVVDRQLVAITFGPGEVVTGIERYGLEDGRVVPLTQRTTDSTVRDTTFLRQLLGNLGRVQASDFIE